MLENCLREEVGAAGGSTILKQKQKKSQRCVREKQSGGGNVEGHISINVKHQRACRTTRPKGKNSDV